MELEHLFDFKDMQCKVRINWLENDIMINWSLSKEGKIISAGNLPIYSDNAKRTTQHFKQLIDKAIKDE